MVPDPRWLPWPHLMMCYRVFLAQFESAKRAGQTTRVASLRLHIQPVETELSQRGLLELYTDICEREAQRLELRAAEASCTTSVPESLEA